MPAEVDEAKNAESEETIPEIALPALEEQDQQVPLIADFPPPPPPEEREIIEEYAFLFHKLRYYSGITIAIHYFFFFFFFIIILSQHLLLSQKFVIKSNVLWGSAPYKIEQRHFTVYMSYKIKGMTKQRKSTVAAQIAAGLTISFFCWHQMSLSS